MMCAHLICRNSLPRLIYNYDPFGIKLSNKRHLHNILHMWLKLKDVIDP